MMDSLEELKLKIDKFNKARDWDQFHSPANLAKSIMIEGAELLECFQWNENEYDLNAVKEELADVMNYCIQMAMVLDLDIKKIIEDKIMKNAKKYPISKAKGKALKYDKLEDKEEPKVESKKVVKEEPKKVLKEATKKAVKEEPKKALAPKEKTVVSKVIAKPQTTKKVTNEEDKPIKVSKIKGYSLFDSINDKKFYFVATSKTLIRNDKKYKDLSKKKLIEELIDYYDTMDVINFVLSEEEILFLKVNSSKSASINDTSFNFLKDLVLFTDKEKKVAISSELIPAIGKALMEYKDRRDEIELKKENAYLLVGIMRVFGALSNSEINRILSKYTNEEIGNFFELPYAVRHIEYKDEYGTSYFALRDLGLDGLSLVETHGDNLKCNYSKKELVSIGKAYFNIYSSEYKAIAKNPKALALIQKINKEELIRAAGRGEELKVHIMDFYSDKDMTEKDRTLAYNLMKSLPRYINE